jgi:hypothetical protein
MAPRVDGSPHRGHFFARLAPIRAWGSATTLHGIGTKPGPDVFNFEQTLWAAPTDNGDPQRPHKSVMSRTYAHTMIALTPWAVSLCCPHCGRTGTGTASEEDADGEPRLRVDGLSSGFVAVELRPGAGQDIRCVTCNSSALK